MTPKLKFKLALRATTDPVSFLAAAILAGVEQKHNTFPGYGQGSEGYAKRFGAAYADALVSKMVSRAILPTVLHQDPRYFYRGSGSVRSRIFYALRAAVITRGDNGRMQPNYSQVLGNFAASGISNLYRAPGDRTASLTFRNGLIMTASGAVENLLREFFSRKLHVECAFVCEWQALRASRPVAICLARVVGCLLNDPRNDARGLHLSARDHQPGGIGSGLVVLLGLLGGKRLAGWTGLFLATTVATSVTGFGFPVEHFLPSHGVGILSLVVLAIAIVALYAKQLSGGWRRTYVITSVIALYLNCFVAVVQSFEKIARLRALAPTQSEPPFAVAQLAVLALFVGLGILAVKRFRGQAGLKASAACGGL